MVSKTISADIGNTITYKVIKDGYKTVTNSVDVVESLPNVNIYNLTPSSTVFDPTLDYTVDTSLSCPPVITFNSDIVSPDDTVIKADKYICVPYGQKRCPLEWHDDNFTRAGNIKISEEGIIPRETNERACIVTPEIDFGLNDYEIMLQFNIESYDSQAQTLIWCYPDGWFNCALTNGNSPVIHSNSGNGSSWINALNGKTAIKLNKDYLYKCVRTDGIRTMYLSEDDGKTWSNEGSIQDTLDYGKHVCWLSRTNSVHRLLGSRDLSKTYIKINGELVWQPVWNVYRTNYNVKVGTLFQIKNGITQQPFSVSGGYVDTIPRDFDYEVSTYDTWEWVFKIEEFVSNGARQAIYSSSHTYESMLQIEPGDRLILDLNPRGEANTTHVCGIAGTTVLETGKSYWVKAEFTGTAYKLWLSTDGIHWNLEGIQETTTKMWYNSSSNWHIGVNNHSNSAYQYPFQGKINLYESYIKVNGEYWWKPITTRDIDYPNMPSNGLIWTKDDILTNFGNKYMTLPNAPAQPVKSYEVQIKFDIVSWNSKSRYIGNNNNNIHSIQLQTYDDDNQKTRMWYGHPSSSYTWQATYLTYDTYQANKWYWVKARWNIEDNKVTLFAHTEGEDWVPAGEFATTGCGWDQSIQIGADQGSGILPTDTKIDLKETYIKINGEYYWQPVKDALPKYDGILDPSYTDSGNAVSLNLYDLAIDDERKLVLNTNRNITVDNVKFTQCDGKVNIPQHLLSSYNELTMQYKKYKEVTLEVDSDTTLYMEEKR